MMMLPSGVKLHIAAGVTDMRKGMDGLAMMVQSVLQEDPFSGHLFAFRGRNPVERAIQPVALGRKNHLFAGSDQGGKRWVTVCSLVETAKLNHVEPSTVRDVCARGCI